jgi:leader peptidase (prepilin peptidase)/N-methyltransferase
MGLALGAIAGLAGGFWTSGWVRRRGAAMPAWGSALALALVLALLGARWHLRLTLLPVLITGGCLWTAAIIDAWTFRIPNLVVIVLAASATAARLVGIGIGGTVAAAVAAVIAGGAFLALSRATGGGFGLGDVKLAAALVWALGWQAGLVAIVLTVLAGGIGAALLLATRRRHFGSAVPYAPFFLLGGILALWLAAPR